MMILLFFYGVGMKKVVVEEIVRTKSDEMIFTLNGCLGMEKHKAGERESARKSACTLDQRVSLSK
jgi:hypothetical protein